MYVYIYMHIYSIIVLQLERKREMLRKRARHPPHHSLSQLSRPFMRILHALRSAGCALHNFLLLLPALFLLSFQRECKEQQSALKSNIVSIVCGRPAGDQLFSLLLTSMSGPSRQPAAARQELKALCELFID